jgi:hypothetical protein
LFICQFHSAGAAPPARDVPKNLYIDNDDDTVEDIDPACTHACMDPPKKKIMMVGSFRGCTAFAKAGTEKVDSSNATNDLIQH